MIGRDPSLGEPAAPGYWHVAWPLRLGCLAGGCADLRLLLSGACCRLLN